jgi:acetylornithine deacetylase
MHKGIMMESVRVTGQSGHSSDPSLGNSALDGMHLVLGELLALRAELGERFNNPLFEIPHPTLNIGCIHGGDSPNRICGSAELNFDLRMVPGGGDNDSLREDITARLDRVAARTGLGIELVSLIGGVNPFEQAANSELVQLAEKLTGYSAESVAFATEAPFLQQLGMETIIMGPGSIDRAHQPDEYIEMEQLDPAIATLRQFIRHYCT